MTASTTRFYLSSNTSLDASDTLLSVAAPFQAWPQGQAVSAPQTLTIPSTVAAGSYYIFAKADADDVVVETDDGTTRPSAACRLAATSPCRR